jgi:hypothetical protein
MAMAAGLVAEFTNVDLQNFDTGRLQRPPAVLRQDFGETTTGTPLQDCDLTLRLAERMALPK